MTAAGVRAHVCLAIDSLVVQSYVVHSGTLLWGRYRQLRRNTLWAAADELLLTRAQWRASIVLAWVVLAALTAPGRAWIAGLPTLAFTLVSLLHASQPLVIRLQDELSGPLSTLLRKVFIYPDSPHIAWPGVGETLGAFALTMATGWPGRTFLNDPTAAAVGEVIAISYTSSFLANVTTHVVWEIDRGPGWMHRIRPLIAPAGALISALLLWPASSTAAGHFVALLGPVFMVGACWRLMATTRTSVLDFDMALVQARDLARVDDSMLVHSTLKNPARAVLEDLPRISDPELRDRVQRLCYKIGGFASSLTRGIDVQAGSANDAVTALLAFNEEWDRRYSGCVLADLELHELSKRDRALVFVAVSDLVTNAARHGASQLEVRLTASPAELGCRIELSVLCRCGARLSGVDPASSLMALDVVSEVVVCRCVIRRLLLVIVSRCGAAIVCGAAGQ